MILTNRLFERVPPSRDARSIYIFSEGAVREFEYFQYFVEIDSRINIEVYKLGKHEDNSPSGLLKIAENCILKTNENPNPKYNFIDGDQVWIVLDTDKDKADSRTPQLKQIKNRLKERDSWFLSVSNPCFEVWLYYHFFSEKPELDYPEKCPHWKRFLNESIRGGFDSRKHPIYIEKARSNALRTIDLVEGLPGLGCTEVYQLADSIIPLLKEKIDKILRRVN